MTAFNHLVPWPSKFTWIRGQEGRLPLEIEHDAVAELGVPDPASHGGML